MVIQRFGAYAVDETPGRRLRQEALVGRLLERARARAAAGDIAEALRCADAVVRRVQTPESLDLLARLRLAAGQPLGAVEAQSVAAARRDDPNIEAALIEALLAAGQISAACERLATALGRFAVSPGDPLALAGAKTVVTAAPTLPGWVGRDPDLGLWGEAPRALLSDPCALGLGPGGAFEVVDHEGAALMRFGWARAQAPAGRLHLAIEGRALAGSGQVAPDFRVDGRGLISDGIACGWAIIGWSPHRAPRVVLSDGRDWSIEAAVEPAPGALGRYRWRASLESAPPDARALIVAVEAAPGELRALPGSPLALGEPPRAPRRRRQATAEAPASAGRVDVIIPVQRHGVRALNCIRSVLGASDGLASVIVVDDANPDPELCRALDHLAEQGAIALVRHAAPLGLAASVSAGCALRPERDVVLLDPAAEVFGGWLERLRKRAWSGFDVGMVSSLAARGPQAMGLAARFEAGGGGARLARAAAEANADLAIEASAGLGSCVYVRRDCLDETGAFDLAAASGEPGDANAFERRASGLGWRHVIAADVYVAEPAAKTGALRLLGVGIPRRRPGDPASDDGAPAASPPDPAQQAWRRIAERELREEEAPWVLLVSHALEGGVDKVIGQRVAFWRERSRRALVLRPGAETGVACLALDPGESEAEIAYPAEARAQLENLLRSLPIDAVELHHFLDLDPAVVDAALALGAPYSVYVHDYSWLCTRVTMVTAEHAFCREPALPVCKACGCGPGSRPEVTIPELRRRSQTWLSGAARIVVPSRDAGERLRRYFPGLEIALEPWEAPAPRTSAPRKAAGRVKIAVIGAIGDHKGYEVLSACAADAARRGLDLEFVVIGHTEDDAALMEAGEVFVTGRYGEAELRGLIEREAPDGAFFASIWPETWCFTLSAALEAGLPILAFDIGALGERLKGVEGALIPLGLEADEINDRLIALARPALPIAAAASSGSGLRPNRAGPALALDVTPNDNPPQTSHRSSAMEGQIPRLNVTGQIMALNKGIYQVSVKSAAPSRVGEEGDVILPAVHVGPAPGVSLDTLEIMTGLNNHGDWVFARRDVLIVKVKASPTQVLVTSVSAESMPALDVAIERLDNRAPTPAPAVQQARQLALPTPPSPTPAQIAEARSVGGAPAKDETADATGRRKVGVSVVAHVQNKGDVTFGGAFWAGAMAEGLAIEGFSLTPVDGLRPGQIEYKAVNAQGAETPWTLGGEMCGARGGGIPLTGFAIRMVSGADADFECEYRGAFGSGKIVGPVANGAPCVSPQAGDVLHGVQVSIVERRPAPRPIEPVQAPPPQLTAQPPPQPQPHANGRALFGPKFSVFREELAQ